MIAVSGMPLYLSHFPDGTWQIKANMCPNPQILWKYEDDGELFQLQCLKDKLDEMGMCNVSLVMPYIPNARMDKTTDPYECVTLKTFIKNINRMDFSTVYALDPHSVQCKSIKRLELLNVRRFVKMAADRFMDGRKDEKFVLFYPDEGSMKRSEPTNNLVRWYGASAYTFGRKVRNYEARTVASIEIDDPSVIKDANVLIVDDICSKGSTFVRACDMLKRAGAKRVGLYVSHCEDNIYRGDVLENMDVFTTDSLKRCPRSYGYDQTPWSVNAEKNEEYFNGKYRLYSFPLFKKAEPGCRAN